MTWNIFWQENHILVICLSASLFNNIIYISLFPILTFMWRKIISPSTCLHFSSSHLKKWHLLLLLLLLEHHMSLVIVEKRLLLGCPPLVWTRVRGFLGAKIFYHPEKRNCAFFDWVENDTSVALKEREMYRQMNNMKITKEDLRVVVKGLKALNT